MKKSARKISWIILISLLALNSCSLLRGRRQSGDVYMRFPDNIFLGFIENEALEDPMVVLSLKDSCYYITSKEVFYNYNGLPFPPSETEGMYQVGIGVDLWTFEHKNFVRGYSDKQLDALLKKNAFIVFSEVLTMESRTEEYEIYRFRIKPEKYLMELVLDNYLIVPPYDSSVIDLICYDSTGQFIGMTVFGENYKSNFYRAMLLPIFSTNDLKSMDYDKYQSYQKMLNMNPEMSEDSLKKFLGIESIPPISQTERDDK